MKINHIDDRHIELLRNIADRLGNGSRCTELERSNLGKSILYVIDHIETAEVKT